MYQAKHLKLSEKLLKELSIPNIIYAELAESGAMGNVGGIMIYLIENEEFICYETSIYTDEDIYIATWELLVSHQDGFQDGDIKPKEILFDYYYGGMGNHVLINKANTLKKGDHGFIHTVNNQYYWIACSVQGVFNCVAYAIESAKNDQ